MHDSINPNPTPNSPSQPLSQTQPQFVGPAHISTLPTQASPHFQWSEFMCPHCHMVYFSTILLSRLESLRSRLTLPIRITSGYRCRDHNSTIPGAAPNSTHVTGLGVYLVCPMSPYATLLAHCVSVFEDGGVGRYSDGHVHVDLGPKRRW